MSNWIDTLKALAPTVATALGGPLVGAAVAEIGSVFGVSEPTVDKIAAVINDGRLTPDHLAAIRELEMKYQAEEKERGFRYSELVFKDMDSARNLAVQTKSNTPTILSYGVLLGGGAMLWSVLYGYAKADSVLAGTLIGYAVSEMKQVLAFWFGSSIGSSQKTDALVADAKAKSA